MYGCQLIVPVDAAAESLTTTSTRPTTTTTNVPTTSSSFSVAPIDEDYFAYCEKNRRDTLVKTFQSYNRQPHFVKKFFDIFDFDFPNHQTYEIVVCYRENVSPTTGQLVPRCIETYLYEFRQKHLHLFDARDTFVFHVIVNEDVCLISQDRQKDILTLIENAFQAYRHSFLIHTINFRHPYRVFVYWEESDGYRIAEARAHLIVFLRNLSLVDPEKFTEFYHPRPVSSHHRQEEEETVAGGASSTSVSTGGCFSIPIVQQRPDSTTTRRPTSTTTTCCATSTAVVLPLTPNTIHHRPIERQQPHTSSGRMNWFHRFQQQSATTTTSTTNTTSQKNKKQ